MSYLTDAVHEITTAAENAAFYIVEETDVIEPSTKLDAREYAERMYCKEHRYDGPLHSVAEHTENGFRVMIMEETTD